MTRKTEDDKIDLRAFYDKDEIKEATGKLSKNKRINVSDEMWMTSMPLKYLGIELHERHEHTIRRDGSVSRLG
jgi:hypothetical protein